MQHPAPLVFVLIITLKPGILPKNGTLLTTVASTSGQTPPNTIVWPKGEKTREVREVVLIGGTPFIALE